MREKTEWKKLIDDIHKKHINYICKETANGSVFHYTSPNGLLGIISKNSVWFSNSDYLNDISESDYFHEVSSNIIMREKDGKKAKNLAFRTYLISMFHSNKMWSGRQTFSREKERRYIFSLSLDSDSLSLWNYYTKTADTVGYNIGFNLEKLVNSLNLYSNQELMIGRVIYDCKIQKELLNELYDDYLDIYEKYTYSYQRRYLYEALEDNLTKYSVFMKNPAFMNENEFRVAVFEKGESQEQKYYCEKNGAFVPYIIKEFDISSVSSIRFSATTQADFVEDSVMDLCENYNIHNIITEKSQIPIRY